VTSPLNPGDALAECLNRQIEFFLTAANNKYVRALGYEEPSRCEPDAGGAASNHRNSTLQFPHDWFPSKNGKLCTIA